MPTGDYPQHCPGCNCQPQYYGESFTNQRIADALEKIVELLENMDERDEMRERINRVIQKGVE